MCNFHSLDTQNRGVQPSTSFFIGSRMRTAKSPIQRAKLTPPQLAQRWGIDKAKIIAWIRSGELRAINASTIPTRRPRYLINEKDIQSFEQAREVLPACPLPRARRNHRPQVKQYVSRFFRPVPARTPGQRRNQLKSFYRTQTAQATGRAAGHPDTAASTTILDLAATRGH